MTSAQHNRNQTFSITNGFQKRQLFTSSDYRQPLKLFSPQEVQNVKLNNLRQKRKQLQQKLKSVSNRLKFRKKKQEHELRKFIRSQEKSLSLLETQNYKKFNQLLKQQLIQRNQFESKKKAKEVEEARSNNQRKLTLIYQALRDRKLEESEKIRHSKKIDQHNLKFIKQMAFSNKKQQYDSINKMKQRQSTKKRFHWYEKRMSFQQKLIQQAEIYEKQIQNYYKKIQALKETQDQLRQQQAQAQQVLRCAQQNFQLLKQS